MTKKRSTIFGSSSDKSFSSGCGVARLMYLRPLRKKRRNMSVKSTSVCRSVCISHHSLAMRILRQTDTLGRASASLLTEWSSFSKSMKKI